MRLHSAFLNRQAAHDAKSVFAAEHEVKQIYRDGVPLWDIVKQEQQDDDQLAAAEQQAEIPDIIREEREEIKDIEDLANQAFKVIREGVLLIHTQLAQLRKLLKEDEVLRQCGFPIEVADKLEVMLKEEMVSIMFHLRQMSEEIDNSKTSDSDNSNE